MTKSKVCRIRKGRAIVAAGVCLCIYSLKPGQVLWLKSVNQDICEKCGKIVMVGYL